MSGTNKHNANDNPPWLTYWNQQTDARHASAKPDFQQKLAAEMRFHMGDIKNAKVLEIGCGDGALIPYLPLHPGNYTGVDFSTSLLEIFKQNHPDYTTEAIGALEYLQNCNKIFDLVFSFGVLQYFDSSELIALFNLQKQVLTSSGRACHFGVPVKEHQQLFSAGQGVQQISNFKPRPIAKQLKSKLANKIGNWHKLHELHQTSVNAGFTTNIYGGMSYLYRVNVVQNT